MLFSCCYFTTTTAILDFHNHLQSSLLLYSLSSLSADILMSYFMEKIWAYQENAFNFFSEPKLVSLLLALSPAFPSLWKISASFFPIYLFLYICELKEIVMVSICYSFLSHLVLTLTWLKLSLPRRPMLPAKALFNP